MITITCGGAAARDRFPSFACPGCAEAALVHSAAASITAPATAHTRLVCAYQPMNVLSCRPVTGHGRSVVAHVTGDRTAAIRGSPWTLALARGDRQDRSRESHTILRSRPRLWCR